MTAPHAPDDLAGLPFWRLPSVWSRARVAWIELTLSAYAERHSSWPWRRR